MILQALNDYYERKAADPDSGIAPPGFEWKEIPFVIVLDEDGKFVDLQDTRQGEGKKKTAKSFLVPQAVKRSRGIQANLFWDNLGYVMGIDAKGKPQRAKEQQQAFNARIREGFPDPDVDSGIKAVLSFLESGNGEALRKSSLWEELLKTNPNLTFRLKGQTQLVCQSETVRRGILYEGNGSSALTGLCLVSGEHGEIERLHPPIKGVWGAQTSGANVVSFNLDAFNSFGKTQGNNAPVGKRAAFSYTTALNRLLAKDSRQRMQVGDASTVFWAERANPMESLLADLFGEPDKDDPDRKTQAVRSLYAAPQTGAAHFEDDSTRFYVLGLAPNASRIAVRFWHVSTVGELVCSIRAHFDDITIVHAPYEPEYLSLFRLLVSTAPPKKGKPNGDPEKILPNLASDVMKSILAGTAYPQTLLQATLRRIKAEQSRKNDTGRTVPNINYARAAVIKAYLNRHARIRSSNEKEIKVSLDETNSNVGYRLGRLFAVLEKVQEEANPGLNATIRDRFYGAASSTPAAVFPTLMKPKNHHISKLENRGRAVNLERKIGAIVDGIEQFPSLLSLADQGRFAIGYYHQRPNLFKKSQNSTQGE